MYAGAMHAEAFLVAKGRVYSEGHSVTLSDHYGVLAFVDIHDAHSGTVDSAMDSRDRRGALTRIRDHAIRHEEVRRSEMSRVCRQQAVTQWAVADAEREKDALEAARKQLKKRRAHREKLQADMTGSKSLFFAAMARVGPEPAASLEIPGSAVGALSAVGVAPMPLCELPSSEQCSFAGVLGQIFLRVKVVASWLRLHRNGKCVGVEGGCVACALQATRQSVPGTKKLSLIHI